MWFLLQKFSKKPSCSSCLPLLFTGDFPKIKCCWRKGLLNTWECVSHWVCGLSALLAEAVQDTPWPGLGWATASSWGMLEVTCGPSTSDWGCSSMKSFQGTALVKRVEMVLDQLVTSRPGLCYKWMVGGKAPSLCLVPECMVLEIQVCCKKSFICFTYCWASQRCHRLAGASARWTPEQKTIQPSQTRFTLSTMA